MSTTTEYCLAVRRISQMCPMDLYDYIADHTEDEGLFHGADVIDVLEMRKTVCLDLDKIGTVAFFANVNG